MQGEFIWEFLAEYFGAGISLCENYKSFVEEMDFSMTPAPKQKGLDYSILRMQGGSSIKSGSSTRWYCFRSDYFVLAIFIGDQMVYGSE